MQDFKNLQIWERSHRLTLVIYKVTELFPKEEIYGLISQIRRSSSSIPTNIAEGCGRFGDAELARFLQIALGSTTETEYHLILAKDLGFLKELDFNKLSDELIELRRMLISFIQKLREKSS
jgi:four helix bundle protein